MLELGYNNSQINKTVGVHGNFQELSASMRAQESIGKDLSGQTFSRVSVNLKLPLFPEVEHKWKTSWFDYAMEQLSELDRENAAEGYPPISDNIKDTAKQILNELNSLGIESSSIVYSTMEGEIAISMKSKNFSLLILVINEKKVETYSSFFNGDTEISSDTAPFKNFYYFLMTQLARHGETYFKQSSHIWMPSPEKEKQHWFLQTNARNQSSLEIDTKNSDLLRDKSSILTNTTQHRISLATLGSFQIVETKQSVALDVPDNRLSCLSLRKQTPQPALLARNENLRIQSLLDFASRGPRTLLQPHSSCLLKLTGRA